VTAITIVAFFLAIKEKKKVMIATVVASFATIEPKENGGSLRERAYLQVLLSFDDGSSRFKL